MAIELNITWEGEVPGIAEHRLSVSAFGPALSDLLKAYRRIASNMLNAAADYAEKGRLNELANQLDIEIVRIEGNSVGVAAVCTFHNPRGVQGAFPYDIPERAASELLESIQKESTGHPYNKLVRNYLKALPPLTKQTYEAKSNNVPLHATVVIDNINLADATLVSMASLVEFEGHIISVGFEPGIRFVKVKTDEETISFTATARLVEKALELRGEPIRGLAVKKKDGRLLRLQAIDEDPFSFTDDIKENYVFKRWEGLLKKLAQ